MKSIMIKTVILSSLFVTTVLLCLNSVDLKLEEGSGVVMNVDFILNDHSVVKIEPSEIEKKQLPGDTTFDKRMVYPIYVKTKEEAHGNAVFVTTVLSGADSRSIHRPEVCLPGQGWDIMSRKVQSVALDAGELEFMELQLQRKDTVKGGGERITHAVYCYFLVGKDVVTPHTFKRILISNWDNLAHNKAHRWAYPSFMASYAVLNDGRDEQRKAAMIERNTDVIKLLAPQILKPEILESLEK